MEEVSQWVLGIIVLALGAPLGNLLAKSTKEELRQGRKWFKLLMIVSLMGAIVFLFVRIDAIFFSLLFIAIVTSRSLKK